VSPILVDNSHIHNLGKKYGYLPYMIERYFKFLGKDQTEQLLIANKKPLTPSIRVNTLKINTQNLKNRLVDKGFKLKILLQCYQH
jgi:16S rRNA C967 or C1407 C5-methylase (RsmB/RsmF family)